MQTYKGLSKKLKEEYPLEPLAFHCHGLNSFCSEVIFEGSQSLMIQDSHYPWPVSAIK